MAKIEVGQSSLNFLFGEVVTAFGQKFKIVLTSFIDLGTSRYDHLENVFVEVGPLFENL